MTDFKPAWWQLKKPIISYNIGWYTAVICICFIIACGLVFLGVAIAEKRESRNESLGLPVSKPKITGKDTLPVIYACSSTLGALILLRIFNVIEHDKTLDTVNF